MTKMHFFRETIIFKVFCRTLLIIACISFTPYSLLANDATSKHSRAVVKQIINLRDAPIMTCDTPMPNTLCHKVRLGNLEVLFEDTGGLDGQVVMRIGSTTEFSAQGKGEIFFFPVISGGRTDEGALSSRNYFCISTCDGNRGFEWNGKIYQLSVIATKQCPIK